MELIVISDLHLSVGYDEKTGRYSRNEDFFFDEEFKRFLEYLQKAKSPKKHLIIAGDLFDFLQVDGDKVRELYKDGKTNESYKKWRGPFKNKITKREKKFGLGTEEEKTVWKLGQIVNGHPVFFQALANFVSKGNRLSIITGNHDIELYWNKVQKKLVNRIIEFKNSQVTDQQIEDRIDFYPWFYYDKDYKTYIEHGNQYDPLNSFRHFLYPRRKLDSEELWLPFGSFFVRYFFNKLEISNPFADNIKPPTKYMRWAWKEDKLQFLKNIFRYFFTMIRLFLKGGKLSRTKKELLEKENDKNIDELALKFGPLLENENDKKLDELAQKFGLLLEKENDKKLDELAQKLRLLLEKENDTKLDELAQKFGLTSEAVKKIYSLKARPFSRNKLLNILTFSTFTFIIIAILVSIVLFLPLNASLQTSLYSFGLLIVPLIRRFLKFLQKEPFRKNLVKFFEWIQKHLNVPTAKWLLKFLQKDPFEKILPKIKEHLEDARIDVQTIVFGHTHDPDIRIVASDCKYFNTGTWTTVFSEEERIIREAKQFAFVWIKKEKDGTPQATLHRWNDSLERHEKLILFEPKP